MNGSRDKKLALAINDEGTTVVGDVAGSIDEGKCKRS
jgi:hypothetical protein